MAISIPNPAHPSYAGPMIRRLCGGLAATSAATPAVAAAGVVLGHWIGYALAVPDPDLRDATLAATGHGYLAFGAKAAVVLAAVATGTALLRRFAGTVGNDRMVVGRFATLAGSLAVIQVAGFAAMEITERLAAGAPLSGLLFHHVFLLGLGVQVLVAAVAALVLHARVGPRSADGRSLPLPGGMGSRTRVRGTAEQHPADPHERAGQAGDRLR
jgi:hypothetical protein